MFYHIETSQLIYSAIFQVKYVVGQRSRHMLIFPSLFTDELLSMSLLKKFE